MSVSVCREAYRKPYTCTRRRKVPRGVQEEYDAKVKEEQKALTREEAEHPDLILVDMIDAYRNLPRKLKESYRWALANTGAAWFMKADDDQYIRVGKTTDYFRQLGRFRND
jgi:hypothetical protein|eukprot:SAG25_NODE_582_length_6759_cov_2.468919_4_plen_111_part_00